jgi:predicted nucleic acid-binding protein
MARVTVLDACVLTTHLDEADAHHQRATRLLESLAGRAKSVSVLTRAEVLVAPALLGRRRTAEESLDRLRVQTKELSAPGGQLAELRARTGLRMPDCCVLLTAETSGAELATFDERLARLAAARGVTVRTE